MTSSARPDRAGTRLALATVDFIGTGLVLKLLVGIGIGVAALWQFPALRGSRMGYYLALLCLYGGASLLLLLVSRSLSGRRLAYLLATLASPYSDAAAGRASGHLEFAAGFAKLDLFQFNAFAPVTLWLFVVSFPRERADENRKNLERLGLLASLGIGLLLFLANAALWFRPSLPLSALRRAPSGSLYWPALFLLMGLAITHLLAKVQGGSDGDRRKAMRFSLGFALGLAPLLVVTLAESAVPEVGWIYETDWNVPIRLMVGVGVLSIPLTTAWAIAVDGAVSLKRMPMLALRYSLQKGMLAAVSVCPLVALLAFAYEGRRLPLRELVGQPQMIVAGLAMGVVALASRQRGAWAAKIERRYFRSEFDLREALVDLNRRLQPLTEPEQIADALREAFAKTVRPQTMELLMADGGGYQSLHADAPAVVTLSGGEDLARALLRIQTTESIALRETRVPEALHDISETEYSELVATGARSITPLLYSSGEPLGALVISDKQSETDLSDTDLAFIENAAHAAAARLESALLRTTLQSAEFPSASNHRLARQCLECRRISSPETDSCQCGGSVRPIPFPKILEGKFEIEAQVGRGGMGVVYRARDLVLGRVVALKTLPLRSARGALRLKQEARAIAQVSHEHLALIYGAETWRDIPVLVFEFLEGGTLQSRLVDGPLKEGEAIGISRALAAALCHAHERGIFHRDVKPSNIGFTSGVVKLLDFGVASMLEAAPGSIGSAAVESLGPTFQQSTTLFETENGRRIVGTPLYMSPEALKGESTLAINDLWSLSVVLYEMLLGVHPFRDTTAPSTYSNIMSARIRNRRPCPSWARWSHVFDRLFSLDRSVRPQNADEFLSMLEEASAS